MHVLRLKLKTTKYQRYMFRCMFYIAYKNEHDKDEFIKHKLSERTKLIKNHVVQRDLYSAFLIKNTSNNQIDKNKCNKEFEQFLKNQEQEIKRLKNNNFKNPNFGL